MLEDLENQDRDLLHLKVATLSLINSILRDADDLKERFGTPSQHTRNILKHDCVCICYLIADGVEDMRNEFLRLGIMEVINRNRNSEIEGLYQQGTHSHTYEAA